MRLRVFALTVAAAAFSGCASDPSAPPPGPAYEREIQAGRPGLFGDLRWNIDLSGKQEATRASPAPAATAPTAAAASAAEQEEFKKWREAAGRTEREEFEEWRAWQEWKRKNPK
jgi:hypothetical protein